MCFKTILIFDSGVGGLTIYQEIRNLVPNFNAIYAFDNAGFPYGEKDKETIIKRVSELIEQISKDYAIDIAVIACNTASTVVLPILRAKFTFPIVGIVPAIKPAAAMTKNNVIGLLATKATIQREYTRDLIEQFAAHCEVKLLGVSELAEMAERKLRGEGIVLEQLKDLLKPWLESDRVPDTIVLGCTHYPLIKEELAAVLPKGTSIIDSGSAVANRVLSFFDNAAPQCQPCIERNIAICTRCDETTLQLKETLHQYGFESIVLYTLTN